MRTFFLNQIQQKLIRKLFKIIKKPYCGVILGKTFQKNAAPSHATDQEFLTPCQNLDKPNAQFLRKCLGRQAERRT